MSAGVTPILLGVVAVAVVISLHASILRIALGAMAGAALSTRRAVAISAACQTPSLFLLAFVATSDWSPTLLLAAASVQLLWVLTISTGIVLWATGASATHAAKTQGIWLAVQIGVVVISATAGPWVGLGAVFVLAFLGVLPAHMRPYVVRKLLLAVPLILVIVTLIFGLLELSPGSVADKFFTPDTPPEVRQMIIEKYRLDDPWFLRYIAMLWNLVSFDFGRSMAQERPVFDIIWESLPNTMLLSMLTLAVVFPTGIVIGTIQAVRQNTWVDTTGSVGSLLLFSMPGFWLAMMLQLFLAFYFTGWIQDLGEQGLLPDMLVSLLSFPSSGMIDPVMYDYMSPWERLIDRLKHLILPGVAMGLASAGSTARYMRSALLEVIRQDYIRTARAKGLAERTVIVKHAMRNALLPIVTLVGLSIPYLFSGSVLIEMIFAWPGMGRVILAAIYTQDTPLIIACFYVFTLLVVAGNLTADVLYAWVDPRIQLD